VTGPVRVAAIDCGTNSLRLLIADVDPQAGRLAEVDRRMEIVRLGQGVDATGRLAPEALARTLAALSGYARRLAAHDVRAVRMVATSATRDAANAADFTREVTAVLGAAPEVLSGAEEAALSFHGATAELPAAEGPYLVVDIGGGSTEFVLGDARPAAAGRSAAISVDIGCVRLTERHLHADPPTPAQIAAAGADIDAALDRVAAVLHPDRAATLVGLAGSVTTLAGLALGLPRYDPARIHHSRLTAAQVMHPGRADVIGGGALVLDHVLRRFGFAEVLVSEHDILDGIAWSLARATAGQPS
jgi:exopolyphosphatase/guanosine-5'-triphosphate,3'-diphosphate pyrophosphatase